jgi:hypothetical protein
MSTIVEKLRNRWGYGNSWELKEMIWDKYQIPIVLLGVILGLFVALYLLMTPLVWITCRQFGVNTGFPVHYDVPSMVCFAEYHDIWLPTDQIFQLLGK